MRRYVVVLVALLIGTSAAATASAGLNVAGHENLEGQFAFGVSGGIVKPNGQIGNEPDWRATSSSSGLDLRYGWNRSAEATYYPANFLAVGLWFGENDLRMRDEALPTANGMETFHMLARGRTSFYGVHVKGFLPSERTWAPYAFVGVARWIRRLDLSPSLPGGASETVGVEVTDDCVGFDGGLGFEQPVNRWLGFTASGRYFYSGSLSHEVQWEGRKMPVHSWDFWSVDLGFTWHAPVRSAVSVR